MPYIDPQAIIQARKMDLLTYLKNYEPQELVWQSDGAYTTKSHDSLKISNGKWMWWSHGFGGYSALDYLIKVRGYSFIEAVGTIVGHSAVSPPVYVSEGKKKNKKPLLLPKKSKSNDVIKRYLRGRCIDNELINYCIGNGLMYESLPYHNVVFLGLDNNNKPQYAGFRSTGNFRIAGDCSGSNKDYSFRLALNKSSVVHLFECPIDLLSYATLLKYKGRNPFMTNLVSLAGVYSPAKNIEKSKLPIALRNYLNEHTETKRIYTHFDNDLAGTLATRAMKTLLKSRFEVIDFPAPCGKDFNEYLCMYSGIIRNRNFERNFER